MKQLKKLTTSKLFFDKYVNKVVILAKLAALFRERDLLKVRVAVNNYDQKIDSSRDKCVVVKSGWSPKTIFFEDVKLASKLLDLLEGQTDYAMRVEGDTVGIYTNDVGLVNQLTALDPKAIDEVSYPKSDTISTFLLSNPNTIVSKRKEYEYKIKLAGLGDTGAEDFKAWASKIAKIKVTNRSKSYIWGGGHVYVADAKTLTICKLYLGKKIRRIDRIVLESEI